MIWIIYRTFVLLAVAYYMYQIGHFVGSMKGEDSRQPRIDELSEDLENAYRANDKLKSALPEDK